MRVTGWPAGTVVRGKRVMWDGTLVPPAQGQRVRFLETLRFVRIKLHDLAGAVRSLNRLGAYPQRRGE